MLVHVKNVLLSSGGFLMLLASLSSSACRYDVPEPFPVLVERARDISIVLVVSAEIDAADPSGESVIAHVRRMETLRGKSYEMHAIRYYGGICGGHRLDVGQFFLIVANDENTEFDPIAGGNAVLALWPFDYLPPQEWRRTRHEEKDFKSPMVSLRLAIAGKGKLPACEVAEGLARTSSIPVPVQRK